MKRKYSSFKISSHVKALFMLEHIINLISTIIQILEQIENKSLNYNTGSNNYKHKHKNLSSSRQILQNKIMITKHLIELFLYLIGYSSAHIFVQFAIAFDTLQLFISTNIHVISLTLFAFKTTLRHHTT